MIHKIYTFLIFLRNLTSYLIIILLFKSWRTQKSTSSCILSQILVKYEIINLLSFLIIIRMNLCLWICWLYSIWIHIITIRWFRGHITRIIIINRIMTIFHKILWKLHWFIRLIDIFRRIKNRNSSFYWFLPWFVSLLHECGRYFM